MNNFRKRKSLITGRVVGDVNHPNLVAYYDFDSDANDKSGNGNDGTISGTPNLVQGRFGNAYDFDSDDDGIIVSDDDSLDLNEFTVSVWVNPRSARFGNILQKARSSLDVN